LKPTKGKELIKKTAQELNLSEELVKDVVEFYYSIVTRKIENLENATIFLHGLGTLRLSRRKLKKNIEKMQKLLESNSQEDFKKVIKFNLSKTLLDSKVKGLEMCNEYYKEMYEKRNKNLESKRANPGGNQE
jgi:nucleoid DNA-binding protein